MLLRRTLITLALVALTASGNAAELHVDCAKVTGRIRPLHGGNCGPLQEGGLIDLSAYFRQIAIPHTRLHDCHWPAPNIVDIHAVFPDFKADPSDPQSYDFRRTDEYVKAVIDTGSKVIYRLGESIEHTKTKYRVHPPADYDKWAAVCVGIIRHYNEGWADGFRHDIRYWEVWNEPENRPAMWTGTDEDYFRLYETAAKAIKTRFPHVNVGGPSLGATGKLVDGRFEPAPFMAQFLRRCRDRSLPLGFFSWHLYSDDPAEYIARAKGVRRVLDDYGFGAAELHLNEWNYLPDRDWGPVMLEGQGKRRETFYARMGGMEGAAFSAAVLINLQDTPVDVANYFMSDNQPFGLFTQHGVPKKTFYAFKAFSMMLGTPVRVQGTGGDGRRLAVCAGMNEQKTELRVLVSNFSATDRAITLKVSHLPWQGASACDLWTLNAESDLEKRPAQLTDSAIELMLPAPSVCLVSLRKP